MKEKSYKMTFTVVIYSSKNIVGIFAKNKTEMLYLRDNLIMKMEDVYFNEYYNRIFIAEKDWEAVSKKMKDLNLKIEDIKKLY